MAWRTFLGTAAAAAAVPSAVAAAVRSRRPRGTTPQPSSPPRRNRTVAENNLPGERDWWMRNLGAPDAVKG